MSNKKETILFYGLPSYGVDTSKIPTDKYCDFIEDCYIELISYNNHLFKNNKVFYGIVVVIVDNDIYSIKSILDDEPALKRDLYKFFKEYNVSITNNMEPQFYLAERYF